MRELERRVVLSVIDRRWRDHLYEMDYLKDGIGLRAMAQRDPLVEYQREGFAMFQSMMGQIREESVGFLFNLEVEVTGGIERRGSRPRGSRPRPPTQLSYSAPQRGCLGRGRGAQPARPGRARGNREGAAGPAGSRRRVASSPRAAARTSGSRCVRPACRGARAPAAREPRRASRAGEARALGNQLS